MVSVEQAKRILINAVNPLSRSIVIKTADALGYTLVDNIYAPLHLPPFNQSNVDGYAVVFSDSGTNEWKVITEVKAGDNVSIKLNEGEAARIFTGAMVPQGSDLVIMQEHIKRNGDVITYTKDLSLKNGENIRLKGAQIKKEGLALETGITCTPSVIGFISSLGINNLKVVSKPAVTLVVTGNELQPAGDALTVGKVYESNSLILEAALQAIGLTINKTFFVKDDKQSLDKAIKEAIHNTDVLLISGGISVGDYDFVNEVVQENGTIPLFYKVAQKPGKPLYFGKNKNTYVFGLPGNPASALTCFYEYVFPTLRKLQGRSAVFLNSVMLPVSKEIPKKKGLANFLKAIAYTDKVESLQGQESFIMKSFTDANAFIYLPADKETAKVGELVEVHLLPGF